MNNWQMVSIDNIRNGAAKEKLNFELYNAIRDCLDFNKDWKKKRKVVLTLEIKNDDESRENLSIDYQAKAVLVPDKPGSESIVVTRGDNDEIKAFVNNVKQMDIAEALASGAITGYDANKGEGTND